MSALQCFDDLISFTKSGKVQHSITPVKVPRDEVTIYDIIAVLESAQQCNINFYPVTWQIGLGNIGQGATANIHQALIQPQTSLAFKRLTWPSDHQHQGGIDGSKSFHALLSEISVLVGPWIHFHPHIVTLHGICWDINPVNEEVWPVLVFEKAQYGDLESFMKTAAGRGLKIEERIRFCKEIAIAITSLHLFNVVHGDVKPENVLIGSSHSHGYTVKVADFGYCTQVGHGNAQELFLMPGSPHWAPPEWHHHYETDVEGAKRMDSYSFGLLCLWLLYYNTDSEPNSNRDFFEDVGAGKVTLDFACGLTKASLDLSDQEKDDLDQLFNLTLAFESYKRCSDFQQLINLLSLDPPSVSKSTYSPNDASIIHYYRNALNVEFSIAKSISELYYSDYRLRIHIIKCLEKRASGIYSPRIVENAYFQLALAYRIGFGVSKSQNKYEFFLSKSMKQPKDIENCLEIIRGSTSEPSWWKNKFSFSFFNAHNPLMDLSQQWLEHGVLDKAEKTLKREIKDVKETLGAGHDMIGLLKNHLLFALQTKGRWREAEQLSEWILKTSKKMKGENDIVTLKNMGALITTYQYQSKWGKAEALEKILIKKVQEARGDESALALERMSSLAATYYHQKKYVKSEKLQIKTLKLMKKIIGEEHGCTLVGMGDLALVYQAQGKLEAAEIIEVRLLEMMTRYLGEYHADRLTCMCTLAVTYSCQKRYGEAEELCNQALRSRIALSGEEHEDTIKSMDCLASIHWQQGKWKEFKEMKLQIMVIRKREMSKQNPTALTRFCFELGQALKMTWLVTHIQAAKTVRRCLGLGRAKKL